jgi:uncharacterized protein (DUF2141 family)
MKLVAACITLISALLWHSSRVDADTLTVKISGLRAKGGVVRVMLWKDAAGFPTQPEKAIAQQAVAVVGSEAEVSFTGLHRGIYAAAGYQDENNNGTMDRSLLGWPVEPTAASNGARGMMGPPKFADAAFELKQPAQTIRLIFTP